MSNPDPSHIRAYYKRVRARFNLEAKKWVKEHLWWDLGVLLGPPVIAYLIFRTRPDYIVLWARPCAERNCAIAIKREYRNGGGRP
jgi:hypothetical protein